MQYWVTLIYYYYSPENMLNFACIPIATRVNERHAAYGYTVSHRGTVVFIQPVT